MYIVIYGTERKQQQLVFDRIDVPRYLEPLSYSLTSYLLQGMIYQFGVFALGIVITAIIDIVVFVSIVVDIDIVLELKYLLQGKNCILVYSRSCLYCCFYYYCCC